MSTAWSSDFSYNYFKKILQAVKSNFELYLFSGAPKIINAIGRPKIILRHDVDIDLAKALKMAEIEEKFGVRATYMVMVNSPLYDMKDKLSQSILFRLISMGHEIGLHFNFDRNEKGDNPLISSLESEIYAALRQLENIIRLPVQSISFHRPSPDLLQGPLIMFKRVNAYSKELMKWYLSDSKRVWREGEPLPKLLNPKGYLLQLLMHPIWWGNEKISAEDILQSYFENKTLRLSPRRVKEFDSVLSDYLEIKRSKIKILKRN